MNFIYSSETANPEPVIPTKFNRQNPVTSIRVTAAAGSYFSEVHYTPTTGSIYHAFQWNALDSQGRKVPTGVYPVVVTSHFAEAAVIEGTTTPINMDIETPVQAEWPIGIQNNSTSPFGAGWSLEEQDRLVNDPTGAVLWAGGDGGVTVFQPGFYTEVLAGTATAGFSGDGGPAKQAQFNSVTDVAYDVHGNLYALDKGNVRVRKIGPDGIVTTVAGNGQVGRPVDGGPATASPLDNPTAIAIDPSGDLYIAEDGLEPVYLMRSVRIRKVDASGTITTAIASDPMDPRVIPVIDDMEFDPRSNTFVTVNSEGNRVYRVFPTGQYEPVAGNGNSGFSGDNGLAVDAKLNRPTAVAIGSGGEIYINDTSNQRIRVVESYGIIRTFAGTGGATSGLQDGVTATLADLDLGNVSGVAVTGDGHVLIADAGSRLIRWVTETGMLYTIAGVPGNKPDAFTSGPALSQVIGSTRMLAVGPDGQIAFTGSWGPTTIPVHHIRVLKPSNNGQVTYTGTVGSFADLVRNADGTFTRRDPDGVVHTYSSQGLKTSWKDTSGNETVYRYTTDNLLETVVEPTGQTWHFTYSGGKLTHVTDSAGRATVFEINGNDDLVAVTDPDAATTRYGYDGSHRMTSRSSALGFRFAATYSPKGQVTKLTEPDTGILGFVPQDSLSLVNDLPSGVGTSCEPAPVVRPESIGATYTDARNNVRRYVLNESRQIVKETDALNRTTEYIRNQAGLVTTLIRPNGTRVMSTYGSVGQVLREEDTGIPIGTGYAVRQYQYSSAWPMVPTTVIDRLGYVTSTELDAAGRPVKVTNAERFIQQTTYNNRGLVTSETNRNGHRTEYEYDSNGNQIRIKNPDGSVKAMTLTPEGYVASVTDEENHRTEMRYTPYGLLQAQKNAQGRELILEYDVDRRLVAKTDERGLRTVMSYDPRNRLVRTESPTGRVQTREYDHENNLTGATDAKNRTTTQDYNAVNQIIRRVQPGNVITTYEYGRSGDGCPSCPVNGGLLGQLTRVVDPNDHEIRYSHDATGRTTGVTNAAGGQTSFKLDAEGNILKRQDPDGQETLTVYDRVHRPMAVVDPRVGYVNRRFDGEGNVVREVNALNQVTEREFNNRGWLIRITVAADTMVASTTKFEYDKVGNLTALVTPRGNRWVFEYDSLKRLSRETDPNNRSATFEYDDDGNVTLMKDRKSQETRYEYNRENEKTAIIYHDGSRVDLEYDDTGQLTRAADARVTVERKYDELDRLKTLTIPQLSRVLETEYDKASNQTGFSINGQKSTYDYDVLNRLIKLVHSSGAQASWEYNPISLVTKKSLPNGITARMTYDRRRLMSMVYEGSSGTQIANFAYTYNEIANILTMTDDEGLHRYEYDFQNRSTSASYPSGPFEMFRYDESSNRIQRQRGSTTEDTTYDAADQIKNTVVSAPPPPCENPDPTKCCQETTIELRDYEHDANGNLTQVVKRSRYQPCTPWSAPLITSFFHDARDKLTQVTLPDGRTIQNEYYPDSPLRLSFTAPGGAKTSTVWDPVTQDLAQDLDVAGAVMAEYIQGTRIDDTIGMIRGGSTYAYVGDHLNSIRALVDGAGVVQNRYRYEAFGSSRYAQEVVANRLRFTAREWEPATGTQYNRWRHYMPQIGRWTQLDPKGHADGPNRFVYSTDNPINLVDPLGLACKCINKRPMPDVVLPPIYRVISATQSVVPNYGECMLRYGIPIPGSPPIPGMPPMMLPTRPDALFLETEVQKTTQVLTQYVGEWTGMITIDVDLPCGVRRRVRIRCHGPCSDPGDLKVKTNITFMHDRTFIGCVGSWLRR